MDLGMTEVIQGIQMVLFGYFLWMQKKNIDKLDKVVEIITNMKESFAKLKAEHDLYKELNLCPLIRSDGKEDIA